MGGTVAVVQRLFNGDTAIPTWSQAVDYPAVVISSDANYLSSVKTGATNLRALIETISAQCPYANIALAGYSQGAHVIGDVLTGTNVSPLSSAARSHIGSVVLFGDPTFRAGEPWDAAGSGSGNGLFARAPGAFASWTRLAYATPTASKPTAQPIVRSFCFTGDRFCQKGLGSDAMAIHQSYASKSTYDAYSFIRGWLISYS